MNKLILLLFIGILCSFDTAGQNEATVFEDFNGYSIADPTEQHLILGDLIEVKNDSVNGLVSLHLLSENPLCFTFNYVGIEDVTYFHDQLYPGDEYIVPFPLTEKVLFIHIKSSHSNSFNEVLKLKRLEIGTLYSNERNDIVAN